MKRLAIIGAGDLGQLIAHHALNDNQYDVVGFYDDLCDSDIKVLGYDILGKIKNIEDDFNSGLFDCLLVGIGYNFMEFRKSVFEKYHKKIPFGNLIHSSAYIDASVTLGEGIIILPGCVLDKQVRIGNNILINTAGVVAHDSTIKDHCFISPSASIAGKTIIEECCIIGINSTIIDNLVIAPFTKIAGGAVVIDDIVLGGLYAGVPAKWIKEL